MIKHPHSWVHWTLISRRLCTHCGLVELRNERSHRAAAASCRWWSDM